MVNLLLDSLFTNEPVDADISCLANPESSLSSLHIDHGVPVRIEDHYLVGRCQIDPETTDTGGQEKDLEVRALEVVELLDGFHSYFEWDIAVHPTEDHSLVHQYKLQQIEYLLRLAEHQYFVACLLTVPLVQEFHKNCELA